MHVATDVTLLTEGTYPYVHGGVSTWCDQLVQGMPELRFHVLGLTGSGEEPVVWPLPPQVLSVSSVPLWGRPPAGRTARGRTLRRFLAGYERFLLALLDPDFEPYFAEELYELAGFALTGWSLTSALRSEGALRTLQKLWRMPFLSTCRDRPSFREAIAATDLLEHALRPLAVQPPARGVAHAVTGGLAVLPGLSAKRFHGVPLILSEHGIYLRERYLCLNEEDFARPVRALILGFYRLLAEECYRSADVVAPCNRYNRRWEEQGGCEPERIRTVYNGVDPAVFAQAEAEPEQATVSWAGRIDPIKDLETLLRAVALAAREVPGLRLRLFGAAPRGAEPYERQLRSLAEELGIGGQVAFEGRIAEVREAYAAGTVVALSSISEGFPFSVIEAMSVGRATVSTDVGGVAEAVGDTGLLVPPREPEAMARALVELLQDHGRRRQLAAAARARVLDRFTVDRTVSAYRALYAELGVVVGPGTGMGVAAAVPSPDVQAPDVPSPDVPASQVPAPAVALPVVVGHEPVRVQMELGAA